MTLLFCLLLLFCYCVERRALHTIDDGRPSPPMKTNTSTTTKTATDAGTNDQRVHHRFEARARVFSLVADEPVTCSTVSSVRVEKTVAAGVVKMISEGTFGGVPVLVIQPYNGTYYREHYKDKGEIFFLFSDFHLTLLQCLIFHHLIVVIVMPFDHGAKSENISG